MFGFEKKKIQLRSVEDYLKTQEVLGAGPEDKPPKGQEPLAGARSFVGPTIGLLLILLLVAAAFSFHGLRSEVAAVKAQKDKELKGLKLQIAGLAAKADKSDQRTVLLAQEVSRLEGLVETERSERAAAEMTKKRAAMVKTRKAKKRVKKRAP